MGTAILHPQDHLARPQSGPICQFLCVAECPSRAASPNGRSFPALYGASSIAETELHGKEVNFCNKISSQGGHSPLTHRSSSAGLLPLQSAHDSCRRLGSRISACRFPEIADSNGIKRSPLSHQSSHASEVYVSSRPSVPMFNYAPHSQLLLSERFPLRGGQLHERKALRHDARFPLNLAQGASSTCAGGTANSCKKTKFLANSHFDDVLNPARLKRADSFNQGLDYKKRMVPELSQAEVCVGRRSAKPPFKVLPDGLGNPICTKRSVADRKSNVYKQLKRSFSEKMQERSETPNLQTYASKDSKKLVTSLSNGVVGLHGGKIGSSKVDLKLTSLAPPAASLGRKVEGPQLQASLDVDTQGQMHVVKSSNVNEGAQMAGIAGCAPQQVENDLCKVDVTSTFNNELAGSNVSGPKTVIGSDWMSKGHFSVSDNDEMWVSMMTDEKWAGPSFFNSPAPSSLPVPSFPFMFSRTSSAGSKPTNPTDYEACMVSEKSSTQGSCTWDVAFATKELRRMLHLDHASFNME